VSCPASTGSSADAHPELVRAAREALALGKGGSRGGSCPRRRAGLDPGGPRPSRRARNRLGLWRLSGTALFASSCVGAWPLGTGNSSRSGGLPSNLGGPGWGPVLNRGVAAAAWSVSDGLEGGFATPSPLTRRSEHQSCTASSCSSSTRVNGAAARHLTSRCSLAAASAGRGPCVELEREPAPQQRQGPGPGSGRHTLWACTLRKRTRGLSWVAALNKI